MTTSVDTIAALATPVGTSAIAVVRISGPQTRVLASALCGKEPVPRRARHADYHRKSGELVDSVVFTFFSAPASYTGEDTLEISCHGNPLITLVLLEDLFARGCRPAEPGEFTKRAFLNGKMDLSQAEAVMDLIHAKGERALAAANQQLRGSLRRHMQALVDGVVGVLAQIEAYIDFPDEDLPPEDRRALQTTLGELVKQAERLLATEHYGAQLRQGLKTVIIGEPNAGKSSIMNRLLGRERALVSPDPGTTRDYLEEPAIIGSHYLRLIDTAGLSPNPSFLERRGIEKTIEQASLADLFVWVLDANKPPPSLPAEIATRMHRQNTISVINKSDLDPLGRFCPPLRFEYVRVSAKHGAGFDVFVALIDSLASTGQKDTGNDVIAINARHAFALGGAIKSLRSSINILIGNGFSELIACELRFALNHLYNIVGNVEKVDVIDQIFTRFCIGK